eukprot:4682034-Prymnesium_polylepis.1
MRPHGRHADHTPTRHGHSDRKEHSRTGWHTCGRARTLAERCEAPETCERNKGRAEVDSPSQSDLLHVRAVESSKILASGISVSVADVSPRGREAATGTSATLTTHFILTVRAASTKVCVCVCVCALGRTRVLWERTFSLPDLEGEMSRDEIAGKSSQRSRSALDVASAPRSTRSILAHSANRRGRCAVQHHLHGGARSAWVKATLRSGHTLTCVPHALWGGGARDMSATAFVHAVPSTRDSTARY